MPAMKCCANCFGDRGLRKEISFLSSEAGACKYCKSPNQILIEPNKLCDKFRALIDITYKPAEEGRSLVQWLRDDWALFNHPNMLDDAHAKELLGDILDDGQIVRRSFVPTSPNESDTLGRWEELRKELMHENRFFPKTQIDFDRLALLLTLLVLETNELPNVWYRARIQMGDSPYLSGDMQAPPPKVATHGRANPAGIPYLYLGSEIITAASEIRAHTGETICVAEFTTTNDLQLVDLRNPRETVSPFSLLDIVQDEQEIGRVRSDIAFLERLGEELTRPVLPHAAAFDYTPSQYLCEFIKKSGYDGVVYRSSVSKGINLALFNPKKATIGTIGQHIVKQVSVDVEPTT